jgi:hypothetical protein
LICEMLVCIASFDINLYLHPLLLIISIVLLYSSSCQFQASMAFLWMELWTTSWVQMIVCIRFFYHSLESIMPPLKLTMNLKCHHSFYINLLVSPSLSLKVFVVFIKRNQGKHSFVASSSKIIANKGVNCLIFTSRSMLPWNIYLTLAPNKQ